MADGLMQPTPSAADDRTQAFDPLIAYVVVELENLWASTAQSLFVSTAFRARDGAGTRIELSKVSPPSDTAEALEHASEYANRWWRHRSLLRALDNLGASNLQQVQLALNVAPGVFQHLHTFRNFYAHRGKDTREKVVQSLGNLRFPRHYTATQALTSPRPTRGRPRPQPLVLDWLDDMRDTIELLV